MSDYGITSGGFIKKRFDEIYDEIRAELLTNLNVDVSANPQGVFNVIVATFADRMARLWDIAESVYYSAYVETATGASLDAACSVGGVVRKSAKPSIYKIDITPTSALSTEITEGMAAAISQDNFVRYLTATESVIISPNFARAVKLSCEGAAASSTVSLSIDNVISVSFTASGTTATDNNALYSQLQLLPPATRSLIKYLVNGTDGVEIVMAKDTNHIFAYNNMVGVSFTGVATFADNEIGPNEYAGTDVYIASFPPSYATYYCETAQKGNYEETDEELRARYNEGTFVHGAASDEAIRSSIMKVDGVNGCFVYVNNTNSSVTDGGHTYPAHSVTPYIDIEDATDDDLGRAIYSSVPAGITIDGYHIITVQTENRTMNVKYYLPNIIYTFVKITLTTSGTLPADYITTVRDLFLAKAEHLTINQGLSFQAIAAEITARVANVEYTEIVGSIDAGDTYDQYYLAPKITSRYEFAEARIDIIIAS